MNRRRRRRLRWKILQGVTHMEMIVVVLAAAAMDSPDPTIPVIALLQAACWIGFFIKANPGWGSRKGGKHGQRIT